MKLTKADKQTLKDITAINKSGLRVRINVFLAAKYGISPSAVHLRIKRLIKLGLLIETNGYEVVSPD